MILTVLFSILYKHLQMTYVLLLDFMWAESKEHFSPLSSLWQSTKVSPQIVSPPPYLPPPLKGEFTFLRSSSGRYPFCPHVSASQFYSSFSSAMQTAQSVSLLSVSLFVSLLQKNLYLSQNDQKWSFLFLIWSIGKCSVLPIITYRPCRVSSPLLRASPKARRKTRLT